MQTSVHIIMMIIYSRNSHFTKNVYNICHLHSHKHMKVPTQLLDSIVDDSHSFIMVVLNISFIEFLKQYC